MMDIHQVQCDLETDATEPYSQINVHYFKSKFDPPKTPLVSHDLRKGPRVTFDTLRAVNPRGRMW